MLNPFIPNSSKPLRSLAEAHRFIDATTWTHAVRLVFPRALARAGVPSLMAALEKRVRKALSDPRGLAWVLTPDGKGAGTVSAMCGALTVSRQDFAILKSAIVREWKSVSGGGAAVIEAHGSPATLRRLVKAECKDVGNSTSIKRGVEE